MGRTALYRDPVLWRPARAEVHLEPDVLVLQMPDGRHRRHALDGMTASAIDGFVAARYLRQWGYRVEVGLLGARDQLKGDAAVMADRWAVVGSRQIGTVEAVELTQSDLVIDALFGAGLSRPIEGDAARLIQRINARLLPVLAVDVPSGVNGTTGEVMGVGASFAEAFVKSQLAAGVKLPSQGKVFISVRNYDKPRSVAIARDLRQLGFEVLATRGTAAILAEAGLAVVPVNKVAEGRPHIVDMIKNGEIALIVNTVEDRRSAIQDSYSIRRSALQGRVTYFTTIAGARAACVGMREMQELTAYSMQKLHATLT